VNTDDRLVQRPRTPDHPTNLRTLATTCSRLGIASGSSARLNGIGTFGVQKKQVGSASGVLTFCRQS
jgi:hypothetical protein